MEQNERTVQRPQRAHCCCCIMPEVEGHVTLDENGICDVCRARSGDGMHTPVVTEQAERLDLLQKKVDRFRTDGPYDCACSVSGGKDSLMTLYIAKEILGLRPLAIMIDSGFSLPEMPENLANASDALGVDSIVFKTADIQNLFKLFLKSGKRVYYCRLCHAILDWKIHDIAQRYNIKLILGGYTKGQQYIKNDELFWIYEESDRNVVEVLSDYPQYSELAEIVSNQRSYFFRHYPEIAQISPFKYMKWNEDEIVELLQTRMGFKRSPRSWPVNSSNCLFNHVAQYLVEQEFGYAQHEVELSELVRNGEMTRERAMEIGQSPLSKDAIEESLAKLGLTVHDIEGRV